MDAPLAYQEGEDFDSWLDSFELYLCAVGVVGAERKRALLLHILGKDIQQKVKALGSQPDEDESQDVYEHTKSQLKILFAPKTRPVFERNIFHNMKMTHKEEDVVEFVSRLKKQAQRCQFGNDGENMIRDLVISKCPYPALQVRLLEKDNLNLSQVIRIWQSHLQVREQASKLQNMALAEEKPVTQEEEKAKPEEVCRVWSAPKPKMGRRYKEGRHDVRQAVTCFRCGEEGHRASKCVATRGKTCLICGGKNHFAKACRSKVQAPAENRGQRPSRTQLNAVEEDFVFSTAIEEKTSLVTVKLDNQPVKVMIDTGASVDIISRTDFRALRGIKTSKTHRRLIPYGTDVPLALDGQFVATTSVNGREVEACWVIAAKGKVSLLSSTTAQLLGLVQLKGDVVRAVQDRPTHSVAEVLKEHEEVFGEQVGKICRVKAQLHLKKEARPVFRKARPVPYALQDSVEEELKKWEEQGVAEKVEYSDWASPMVVVPKPGGKVRICGDFKFTVNPQLEVTQHPMPNLEDILSQLSGMQYFCKLDLSAAYLQMELEEESQNLTVLNTPRGLMKMKRLPYGIASAPALFQSAMEKILHGMKGVTCFLDDVLVAGRTHAETAERLKATLKRMQEWQIRLNKKKCQFMLKSVQYLGVEVGAEGVKPVAEKVNVILEAPQPKNQQELRSFLGAVNFYARFVPDMATVAAPLNELLKKDAEWKWSEKEEKCFRELKRRLTSAPILAHYDAQRPVQLITDASPYGIGAVLMQKGAEGEERPVRFASRTLSKAERNYSQIEREGLAVIFGVTRFRQYLWGRRFTLVTDNKPLSTILGPKTQLPAMAAARIQRWALTLAAYTYDVTYRKSSDIPLADFLSRLPYTSKTSDTGEDEASAYFVESLENLQPLKAENVRLATGRDPGLAEVSRYIRTGWPARVSGELQPFCSKKEELTIVNGCIFWGARVVIPMQLQSRVLEELHDSHPGITRMKTLARSHVWWPKIDRDVEDVVKQCPGCQETRSERPNVFLHPWERTKRPWERVHLDFAGPMRGYYFLVLIDSHSKWPEVVAMKNTTTSATVNVLIEIFARFGIPIQLVSDNGPQLTSQEFEDFMKKLGIKHIRVAPYRPQSNGLAERMVKTLKQSLRAAMAAKDHRTVHQLLGSFLMKYRNVEHATTGVAPAEAMLGRRVRTRMDLLKPNAEEKVLNAQAKQMETSSQQLPEFSVGMPVLVRNYAGGAKWKRGKVAGRTGPVSYTVVVDGLVWSRHAGQLLPLPEKCEEQAERKQLPQPGAEATTIGVAAGRYPLRTRLRVNTSLADSRGSVQPTQPATPADEDADVDCEHRAEESRSNHQERVIQPATEDHDEEGAVAEDQDTEAAAEVQRNEQASGNQSQEAVTTRSGREVKLPAKYRDFVR